jgi:hypothetical protein
VPSKCKKKTFDRKGCEETERIHLGSSMVESLAKKKLAAELEGKKLVWRFLINFSLSFSQDIHV